MILNLFNVFWEYTLKQQCFASHMGELFPDIPAEELEKSVEICEGNVDMAISYLLDCKF